MRSLGAALQPHRFISMTFVIKVMGLVVHLFTAAAAAHIGFGGVRMCKLVINQNVNGA